jgi:aminoglycoside 3-N-acetyltransferase
LKNKIYTKAELFEQLEAMHAPQNGVVLMHSALRLVGKVEGVVEALLSALIEYFTAEGGLFCVPTHTWGNLNREITLDVSDSKTCLGAFSDLAVMSGKGIRTENPTHSMVVFGDAERARKFAEGEIDVPSGTSPESCYGKICEMGGYILLVGVSHSKNTYLHAVEEMLGMHGARLSKDVRTVRVRRENGDVAVRQVRTHSTAFTKDVSLRFPKYETAFRYHGAIRDGFLGRAPAQLCDARLMRDVMALILQRAGRDPLEDELALPPKWYVSE